MNQDHEHGNTPASTTHNGYRSHATDTGLDAESSFGGPTNGKPSPGRWSDDPDQHSDDALMRCYNG
jgi:hypothetical protein